MSTSHEDRAGSVDPARSWIRRPVTGSADQVHGSTLAPTGDGALVAAWFCGPHEGAAQTRIEWSVRAPGGTWSEPAAIQPEPGVACWNPVLGRSPQGEGWLFFRVGARISGWRTYRCRWTGTGFTAPQPISATTASAPADAGPVKNPPLALASGPAGTARWLAGGSTEDWSVPPRWDAHIDVSDDDGRTWSRRPIPLDHPAVDGAGVIQPTLWATPAGDVVALLRSTAGAVYRTVSVDGGDSWAPAAPIDVPNNNSGICAAPLPDGRVVLAHNPTGDPWGRRCPLVLSISEDDGRTFARIAVLEDGVAPLEGLVPTLFAAGPEGYRPADSGVVTSGAGEYSYPTVIVIPDADGRARVLVSYTWQRAGIALAQLRVST